MNNKAELTEFIKILLWIVFFAIAIAGVYFLTKFLTNQ
jgi:hypothetical protein